MIFKMYRVYEKPEKIITEETVKRIKETGRPHSKQEVLNSILLEYKKIKGESDNTTRPTVHP